MRRWGLSILVVLAAGCSEDGTLLREPRAAIVVAPEAIELVELSTSDVSVHPVTITNAGDAVLTVRSAELVGDGLELRTSGLPVSLRPEARTRLEVVVSYAGFGATAGTLLIESDASDRPTVAVPIRARFIEPSPPDTGVAVPGDGGVDDANPLDANPLDAGAPDADSGAEDASVPPDAGFPAVCGRGAATNLLVDPGFSVPPTLGLPSSVGAWVGDQTALVSGEGGVQPASAPRMLAYRTTGTTGPSVGQASQVHQIVDVRSLAPRISSGARLLACGSFNRVSGGPASDRQFTVYVRGYQGAPSTFVSQYTAGTQAFGPVRTDISSDANPSTWERPCLDVPLPPPVDFLGIELRIREDVFNDESGPEFDGHFADDACLAIIAD